MCGLAVVRFFLSMTNVCRGCAIGKYAIERVLGEGSTGTVYLAHHTVLEHPVAIKMLRRDVSLQHNALRRFFLEAKAVAKLRDPGLAQLHDYGHTDDGHAYIVMEYLAGETLSARAQRQGTMSAADTLRIAASVARTLSVVHAQGVVHRDLKPDNVFIVTDPSAEGGERTKILDFGIAKLGTLNGIDPNLTHATELLGTPLYMAPEQWQGAIHVDARADIYALGCIMYRCLCGQAPFVGDTLGKVCAGHLIAPPEPLRSHRADISPAVETLVLRCLEKDANARPADMSEVAKRIHQLAARTRHAPGSTAAPKVAPPQPQRRRANPKPLARTLPALNKSGSAPRKGTSAGRPSPTQIPRPDRRVTTKLPSQRPAVPSRPQPPSQRPAVPSRPQPPSQRPAVPSRPQPPSQRPAVPSRPQPPS
ncbi:MAG TPA: hypothetical protein ENK23_06655, partial [Sorangium sp.]|nr:hypothetical protein [Sorangium sp.]